MASVESLPADQRAVLELVLRRGRSYDEIAKLLSIDRAGVRQRALAAFDALGPKTRVSSDRRALITDYLLDALPGEVANEVRDHLLGSASERAWARAIASELQDLTEQPLPEIPSNGRRPRTDGERGKAAERPSKGRRRAPKAEVPAAAALSNGSPRERLPRRGGSRLGGAILLGVSAAIVLALVLVFVVFTGSSHKPRAAASHRATAPPTHTSSNSAHIIDQVTLTPPGGGNSPVGIAEVLTLQGKTGVAIAAQGLQPNHTKPRDYYGVWLYNGPTSNVLLGFAGAVGSNGILRTAGSIPSTAAQYHQLVITLEHTPTPRTPGRIVLQGSLKL